MKRTSLKIEEAFQELFDDSNYRPHPISLEGMRAYLRKEPMSTCPYTDKESKELWEHGWITTDIGHVKAVEFSREKYDDPKLWVNKKKMRKAWNNET